MGIPITSLNIPSGKIEHIIHERYITFPKEYKKDDWHFITNPNLLKYVGHPNYKFTYVEVEDNAS
jgi:hypothetical protein